MEANPLLEEIWRIKEEIARQADYDIHKLCEQTRQWAAEHPHTGPVFQNAEDLRRYFEEKEKQELVLREEPSREDEKQHP
jgi:hypothetical protein